MVTSSVCGCCHMAAGASLSSHHSALHHSPPHNPLHVRVPLVSLFTEIPSLLFFVVVSHVWWLNSCQLQQLTPTPWHLTVRCCTVLYCALQHTILQCYQEPPFPWHDGLCRTILWRKSYMVVNWYGGIYIIYIILTIFIMIFPTHLIIVYCTFYVPPTLSVSPIWGNFHYRPGPVRC